KHDWCGARQRGHGGPREIGEFHAKSSSEGGNFVKYMSGRIPVIQPLVGSCTIPERMAEPARSLAALAGLVHAAEGVAALRAALDSGNSGTIDGAWGSSPALAVAALAADAPTTLLAFVPGASDVASFIEDLASFTGSRPAVFEAWETWP